MATLRHDAPTLKDGWLLKEGRVLRSRTRRYLRLKGTILSNHHSPSSPASWEVSVISCPVTSGPREHELVLALPTRRLSFFAETTADYDAWVVALRTASARAVEDYYVMGEVLGAGSFAQVHRAVDRGTGEEVAVKVINKAGYDARELEYVVREVAIMRSLNHPNIVSTYDIFETSTHLYLVIELCEGGELFDIVADHGHLSEQRASQVMRSIVRGLEYLHSEGICHRDIKPENILVKSKSWPLEVKLADFGLANFINEADPPSPEPPGSSNDSGASSGIRPMATVIGTPGYVAPEVVKRSPYGPPVDMWAAGVVLYILLSGKMPFYGRTDVECVRRIAAGTYSLPPREWGRISPDAVSLVRALLQLNADRRLTASGALQHRWLAAPERLSTIPLTNDLRGLHSVRRKFRRAVMAALTVQRMRGAVAELSTEALGAGVPSNALASSVSKRVLAVARANAAVESAARAARGRGAGRPQASPAGGFPNRPPLPPGPGRPPPGQQPSRPVGSVAPSASVDASPPSAMYAPPPPGGHGGTAPVPAGESHQRSPVSSPPVPAPGLHVAPQMPALGLHAALPPRGSPRLRGDCDHALLPPQSRAEDGSELSALGPPMPSALALTVSDGRATPPFSYATPAVPHSNAAARAPPDNAAAVTPLANAAAATVPVYAHARTPPIYAPAAPLPVAPQPRPPPGVLSPAATAALRSASGSAMRGWTDPQMPSLPTATSPGWGAGRGGSAGPVGAISGGGSMEDVNFRLQAVALEGTRGGDEGGNRVSRRSTRPPLEDGF
ncbi:hypothetical protein MMPV_004526 [Pyropia vietnamensis]